MTPKFWLNKTYINSSRNEIKRGKELTTMPPKTIAVLSFLAKNQGKVVSTDAIMDHVWRESVVSSSTLQQCITKLRKVLGDDGKQQQIIKTHAKKGYSLEVKVTWDNGVKDSTRSTEHRDVSIVRQFSFLLVGLIVITALIYQWNIKTNRAPLVFDVLTPLTATDEQETAAQYSPDGSFIIFQRSAGFCGNSLWAKKIEQNQEYPLIKGVGVCSGGSFSTDGKQLVFMSKSINKSMKQVNSCFNLMKINLQQAFKEPQIPEQLLSCRRGTFDEPLWLNSGAIILLQYQDESVKLIKYSIVSDELSDFFHVPELELYSTTYSSELGLIAMVGLNKTGEHVLLIVNDQGILISSSIIKRPKILALHKFVYPNFDASRKQLIFSSGKALYSLSFSGDITKINANINNAIYSPKFHPNGQTIIATQGVFDSDIAEISFDQQDIKQEIPKFNQVYTPYSSIERTPFVERDAKYQPSGDFIAFISNRSGGKQLWLKGNGFLKQLSQFNRDSIILGYSWAPDGTSIMVAANALLYRISLDGKVEEVKLEHPVLGIYGWSKNNSLLLNIRIDGVPILARYSIVNAQLLDTIEENVRWAASSQFGEVVYLDGKNEFWQITSTQVNLIKALQGVSTNGSFVFSEGKIFSINNKNQIWSFNLQHDELQIIREIDEAVMKISDVKNSILVTQAISAKKDVVELSVSN